MKRNNWMVVAMLLAGAEGLTACSPESQESAAPVKKPSVAERAFEHYEAVRVALSADTIDRIKEHVAALSADALALGGSAASTHVEALANATTIEDARKHFGELSGLLVPKFLESKLPNVHGFMCAMKKKPWAQEGAEIQNPYYGKSMASCGTAMEKK